LKIGKNWIHPNGDRLILRMSPEPKAETNLIVPDTARGNITTHRRGTIEEIGETVEMNWGPRYWPGVRVMVSTWAGMHLLDREKETSSSKGDELWVVQASDIAGFLGEMASDTFLGELEGFSPIPGQIAVERDEMPTHSGSIIIPDGTRQFTNSNQVTIVASSAPGYDVGERHLVMGDLSKHIRFGTGTAERVIYLCHPVSLVCTVGNLEGSEGVQVKQRDPLGFVTAEDEDEYATANLPGFPEGDPRGLR
jgi:hypothetical protein